MIFSPPSPMHPNTTPDKDEDSWLSVDCMPLFSLTDASIELLKTDLPSHEGPSLKHIVDHDVRPPNERLQTWMNFAILFCVLWIVSVALFTPAVHRPSSTNQTMDNQRSIIEVILS